MLIATILILVVFGSVAASAWFAWQATKGTRTKKTLAAGITAVALVVVGFILVEHITIGVMTLAVGVPALSVATGRLSFWRGLAAGLGAPVVVYGGIILIRLLHGVAFPASGGYDGAALIHDTIEAQAFGVPVTILLIGLGIAVLAAACVASRDARVWLVFLGTALVLAFGIVELRQHWNLIWAHRDDPRAWFWLALGVGGLFALV